MNSFTLKTSVALHPQAKGEALKISPHIAMAPKTTGLTDRTLLRPGSGKNLCLPQPASLHLPQNGVSMNRPLGMVGWGLLTSF